MKKFMFMLMAAMVAVTSFAQNTLVATLNHGDDVSMFYGSNALVNAVDAAESGDVITLSGGSFLCTKITKGITIRGAGVESEKPTYIAYNEKTTGSDYISIPQSDNNRFCMEGVVVSLYRNGYYPFYIKGDSANLYFIKCKFSSSINFTSSGSAKFVNCSISSQGFKLSGSGSVVFTNCYVGNYSNQSNSTSKAEFINCLLLGKELQYYYRSSFINSIICSSELGTTSLPNDISAMNSIFIGGSLSYVTQKIDCKEFKCQEVFKTYTTSQNQYGNTLYTPTSPYELTDEAKTTYLGTDGNEVGLYGGQYPYNFTPNYPHINKLNVAKQATADNKLSVEIEVSAVE